MLRLLLIGYCFSAVPLQAKQAQVIPLFAWLREADSLSSQNSSAALPFTANKVTEAYEEGDPLLLAQALTVHGIHLRKNNLFDSALTCLLEANALLESHENQRVLSLNLDETGIVLDLQGNYHRALDYYQHALALRETLHDTSGLGTSYNNLGILYSNLGDFKRAREYYEKSYAMSRHTRDLRAQANALNNVAISYYYEQQFEPARVHFEAARELREQLGAPMGRIESYHNLADVYLELDSIDKALDYYHRSAELLDSVPSTFLKVYNLYGLAGAHRKLNQYERSQAYALQSLELAKELHILREQNTISLLVYENYKSLNQFEHALAYYELYKQTADSLFNLDKTKAIASLEARATLEKKEQELKRQREVTQRQRIALFGLAGAVSITLLAAVLYNRARKREKRVRQEVEEQREEIQTQAEALQRANEGKDRLLAIIGHDLRNPIASLKGLLALVQSGQLSDKEFASITKNLSHAVDQLYQLVTHLLQWANLQLKGIEPHPRELALRAVAQETVDLLMVMAVKKDIELVNTIPENLSAWGDANMVKVVVRNLTSNALKYTPAGGKVELSATANDTEVHVHVSDTGMGMSRELMDNLFTVNPSSRPGTSGEKGTGLGLQLCHDFTKQMNGTLTVTSREGEGSTFAFTLPVKE